jgi:competence protein ComEC
MDFRRNGARFLLRVHSAEGLAPEQTPFRVRLSMRRTPPFEAGTYVHLKARLLPPARASLPGGYDFAREAWFARLGAVGNVLGRIEVVPSPESSGLAASATMAIDRGRNALARRIDKIVGGDSGAIAAAMVTGKRDLLSDEAKEVIREAGIFHIITISGVQMTLVAAIFFVGLRRLLALSQTLALSYPIKKWAALFAIAGALFYDIVTGSRVGTERALFMTLIMLTSVVLDRQALTMRNLAIAAALVILIQPEAIMGASFQLSFAAVAALVAVYEARMAAWGRDELLRQASRPVEGERKRMVLETLKPLLRRGPLGLLFATFCATSATASWPIISTSSAPCADRQSADPNHHRNFRGAGRARRRIALSARPRRVRVALCRSWHRRRYVGRARDRKLARSDDPPSRLCALGDCFLSLAVLSSGPGGS